MSVVEATRNCENGQSAPASITEATDCREQTADTSFSQLPADWTSAEDLLPGLQTGAHVADMELTSLPVLRGTLNPPRSSSLITSAKPNGLPMALPPDTVTPGGRVSAWVWEEGRQLFRPIFYQYDFVLVRTIYS